MSASRCRSSAVAPGPLSPHPRYADPATLCSSPCWQSPSPTAAAWPLIPSHAAPVGAPTSVLWAPISAVGAPTSVLWAPTSAVGAPIAGQRAPISAVGAPTSEPRAPRLPAAGDHAGKQRQRLLTLPMLR